jgi:hypothetical protein
MPYMDFQPQVFEDVGSSWNDRSSEHEREGILIMWGPEIRRGHRIEDRHIVDIAPTVLHLCGLPVPGYMDGVVIEEAFEREALTKRPVVLDGKVEYKPVDHGGSDRTAEEEAQLKERLRGLGYMG